MILGPLLHTCLRSITTLTLTLVFSPVPWTIQWVTFEIVLHWVQPEKTWLWWPRTKEGTIFSVVGFKTCWDCWICSWMRGIGICGKKHRWLLWNLKATASHVHDWFDTWCSTSYTPMNSHISNITVHTPLSWKMKAPRTRFKPCWEKKKSKGQSRRPISSTSWQAQKFKTFSRM